MRPNLIDFFEQVLPTSGVYATIQQNKIDYKLRHRIFHSVRDLNEYCIPLLGAEENLFFALASFKEGWHSITTKKGEVKSAFRTQDNVQTVRSLWLDIDVGVGKSYPTQKAAIQALRNFLVATGMPCPWVIDSGSGGLHVYWTMVENIKAAEWNELAEHLHAATLQVGLEADPARTRDSASILRVPASNNCKLDYPRKVKLMLWGTPQPKAVYDQLLGKYEPVRDIFNQGGFQLPAGVDSMLGDLATIMPMADVPEDALGAPEYEKREARDVVAGCAQMQLQDNAPEPVWRGMLATLRHCIGGIEMGHTLSKQDPRYNQSVTDEKIALLEEKDIPPYTCATFEAHRPEVCATCPQRGLIKSPISVKVSKITTVEISDTGAVETVPTLTDITGVSDIPDIDTGLFKVNDTGCYALIETNTGGTSNSFWLRIYDYPVYPIQRIRDKSTTGEITISYIFKRYHHKGHDEFQIGGDVLMGQGVIAFLGSVGFILPMGDRKHMAALLVDLLKHEQETLEETSVSNSLGWDTDHNAFLLGNKVYRSDGEVMEVSPKGIASQYSALTVPKGDLAKWTEIANVYNRPGLEWGQVIVGAAFASPLMSMGALEKAALIFATGPKGAGKSTALQLATSVFGDPSRLMINKDDTANARIAKLGILNSITASFDEMTDLSPREASELAYQITQGRGKDRLGDMGKSLQHNTAYWSCLPVMSANDSIISALAEHAFDATAQMSRVLEVEAVDINSVYDGKEFLHCQQLVRSVLNNYGTAGDAYIRYVVANQDKIEKMILQMETLFVKETNLNSNFRFWTYMCTRILTGLSIAKKLGIVDYDIGKIFVYLKGLVLSSLKKLDRYEWKPENLLSDFLNSHLGVRVDVVSSTRPPEMTDVPEAGESNDYSYVKAAPAYGRDLEIRVELKERRGFISTRAVRKWCSDINVPYDVFLKSLKDAHLLVKESTKVTLGKQTRFRDSGRTNCIEISMPREEV